MAIFTGFKPTGLQKIANRLGYEGSLDNFENYLDQNPEKKRQMIVYEDTAKQMAKGGVVKAQQGRFIGPVEAGPPAGFFENQKTSRKAMQDYNDQMMKNIQDQRNQFNDMQKQANEQFKQYQAAQKNVPEKNIIVLPRDFRDNPLYAVRCEKTDTLGGSIPVRNFVYEHSKSQVHKRHWILDDNMAPIFRLNRNEKIEVRRFTI